MRFVNIFALCHAQNYRFSPQAAGNLPKEIEAHVLICFVALMAEKYLEMTTKLSLREIRFLIWNITETHIQDRRTKQTFVFMSPTKEILNSQLTNLITKWNLLPH
jgi:hypothetical protein